MPGQEDADAPFGGLPTQAATSHVSVGPDGRREVRVRANWRARVLLPGERIVELNVFDVGESGIGLVSPRGIPAHAELPVVLAVPALHDPGRITPVQGTIKTSHMTIRGNDVHCGGQWVQLGDDGRDLLGQWIRKLRA